MMRILWITSRSCCFCASQIAASNIAESLYYKLSVFFFFSSRRRHTRLQGDWSSDVCSSDLDLGAHPCLMQERHDQFDAIDLFLAHRLRPAGESEQARRLPESIVGPVRDHRVRPYPVEFARQRALGELTRWSHFTDYGPVGVFFPGLDDVRHHGCILAEHVAEERRLER